ncbi:MAG: hypothetical protein ACKON8_09630 [Planctomycetota bacterium]
MRHLSRWACGIALAVAVTAASRGDELGDRLTPYVGTTIDLIELGTGRRFVRPTLERVVAKEGRVAAIRVRPEGQGAAVTLSLPGIARIVAGRETIHEAEAGGRSWSQLRGRRARETYEQGVAESRARMQARGVEPWPTLSAADHARAVDEFRRFVELARQECPGLAVHETHEFLVASDIPAPQLAPFLADLDAMHDALCDLYGIPRGEPGWMGKCLVVAFLREDDYVAFEARFMKADTRGTQGMCHQRSDGRVVTACHRGSDPAAFAHMLVHETSHGFNHRWMSPQRLPNWLNEGIAEWVGARVVRGCDQVPLKEARAAAFMRSTGGVGPAFVTADNIQPMQYGIASGMVRFLIARDAQAFASFVRAIKEGEAVDAALADSFGGSLDDLLRSYGRSIGLPTLRGPAD